MPRTLKALLPALAAFGLSIGATQAMAQDAALIAKGEYLARAGDCIACHTAREGKTFAGGLPMKTPFGTLYTSNITPDPQTGIGTWTSDQFYQMMHNGRFPDGGLVYPAMPFASYTKVTREESDAIYAYLRSIASVQQPNRPHDLTFPFNNRSLIIGWRTLFFKEGEFKPDPTKSAEWNRGAYLVDGLGHCGMCHTAINALGGSSDSQAFEGGLIPMQELVRTVAHLEQGSGPWRLDHSGDHGLSADRRLQPRRRLRTDGAMAIYLKGLAQGTPPEKLATPLPSAETSLLVSLGKPIYDRQCASCHGATGQGMPPNYPPLAGNQSIEMVSAVNAIRMVLNGGYPPGTSGNPMPYGMPPFAHRLSDDEVAAVVTYIRTSWGNSGEPVSARQANELRAATLN